MSTPTLKAVKGMNDILPATSARWGWLERTVQDLMHRYGYQNIRTPIVEPTALFVRGLGEVTDIVEKEMYSFEDKMNGEQLTLRPEGTAGVVRAAIEHNLTYEGAKRLYYFGQMFRHERPQRGRYRQFHQIGAEVLGLPSAEVDAELILLAAHLWRTLGLQNIALELNTLGVAAERLAHRAALIAYFEQHAEQLDEEARRRLHSNPLRILDTKNPAMQTLVAGAPKLFNFLGAASRAHFERVTHVLDANGVAWTLNHRLVRGMDYYCHTVFEFTTTELGAQATVCGGGRYDGLFEQMGGKPTPAVGWALGVERILELLAQQNPAAGQAAAPQVYAVVQHTTDWLRASVVVQQLREQGVGVVMSSPGDEGAMPSLKSQFKKADASGAAWALVFGESEMAAGQVQLKNLRDRAQTPQTLALDQVFNALLGVTAPAGA